MIAKRLVFILCACSAASWADSNAAVNGPVAGYVFDSQARVVRPMVGIPGAAYMSSPVVSNVDIASVAPEGSAALATRGGQLLLFTGLGTATPASIHVTGSIAAPDRFAWAAGGSSAAIYSSQSRQAQILTGLQQTPAAAAPIDLSSLSGKITAMAFDGRQILIGLSSAGAGGIYSVTAQGAPKRLASSDSPSAIALAGADLYFSDNQSQQIWHVQNYGTQAAAMLFAADSNIATPVGLQVSTDSRRLYVANADNRNLTAYDLASRTPVESLSLDFAPAQLDRFGTSSVLLLNTSSQGKGPLHILSDGTGKLAVYFVPAPAANAPRHPIRYHPATQPGSR
ncbi:MAG: hypothetical protein U0Q18_22360 [Bryobacteraceae bacterium]